MSQVKGFSTLQCMGRFKCLSLLKSFLSYTSQHPVVFLFVWLVGWLVFILKFSSLIIVGSGSLLLQACYSGSCCLLSHLHSPAPHILDFLSSSVFIVGSGWWLPPASTVLPFGGPLGSEIHIWTARIEDDCDILVYRYRRGHFLSHQPALLLELCINSIFLPEDLASPKKPCHLPPAPSTHALPLY